MKVIYALTVAVALASLSTLGACGGPDREVETSTRVIHNADGSTTTVTKQREE
jgi:hypothetical protein